MTNLMDEFDALHFVWTFWAAFCLIRINTHNTKKNTLLPSKSNHQNDAKRCANIQMERVVGWKLRWGVVEAHLRDPTECLWTSFFSSMFFDFFSRRSNDRPQASWDWVSAKLLSENLGYLRFILESPRLVSVLYSSIGIYIYTDIYGVLLTYLVL